MQQTTEPLCYAPFTSFLIDTNKGVRPCCAWKGKHFGNIEKDSLSEIIAGPEWQNIKDLLTRQEWPDGCLGCKTIEDYSGYSVRGTFRANAIKFGMVETPALFEAEINSTNNCNLACLHCSSDFSSNWIKYENLLQQDEFKLRDENTRKHVQQDDDLLLKNIRQIDFSKVKMLRFKGGEPFLNKEVKRLLNYLNDLGLLQQMHVEFFTNGSVIDKSYLELLQKCAHTHITISVDGVGALQKYIRYGNSDTERIMEFIAVFQVIPNIYFSPLCSVMVYNVFNLPQIYDWWQNIHLALPDKTERALQFNSIVVFPEYLCVNALPPNVTEGLIQMYEQMDESIYGSVLQALKMPWAGAQWHTKFVEFTKRMDKYRNTQILEIVPQLASSFAA